MRMVSYRKVAAFVMGIATLATPGFATETITYQYDALGRLTQNYRYGGPLDGSLNTVGFDTADNRTQYAVMQVKKTIASNSSIYSPDGRTQLTTRTDGNLVVYFSGTALWSAGTTGSANVTQFQDDGNLVVYSSGGTGLWVSGTSGHYGAQLVVQNDGNVVIYDRNGTAIWATNTGGH